MPVRIVACETVVIGACAYARVNTVAVLANASSAGVRPRVDPRKPIRSARVVSSVISRMLRLAGGWRLDASGWTGAKTCRLTASPPTTAHAIDQRRIGDT